jgi:hypothetical protein
VAINPIIKQKISAYLDAAATRSLKEERYKEPVRELTEEQRLILKMTVEEEMFEALQKESKALLDLLEYCYNPEIREQPLKDGMPATWKDKIDPEVWNRIFKPKKDDTK